MKKINHIGSYGLVIENNRILLIKKVGGPYDGKLDLPGGTIEENETSEEALIRELEEETGIKPIDYYLFDEDSVTLRWMHKGEEEEICHKGFFYIVNKYEGIINSDIEITKINDDSKGASFYDIDSLTSDKLSNIASLEINKIKTR